MNFNEFGMKESYPINKDYNFETRLKRVNLDEKRVQDILNNKGFIIKKHQGINKDIKEPDSIYSYKYGQGLGDMNPFQDRYRCKCGHLKSRINHGLKCDLCGTRVKYVDDDFKYFGWIVLKDPYYIIHPNMFKMLQAYIGAETFKNIIVDEDKKDKDGYSKEKVKPKAEPFYGTGMMKLKENIDDILEYYKKPSKMAYYEELVKDKDKMFIQSIPVYTTLLRPYSISDKTFNFEGTNAIYNMMCKYVTEINNDEVRVLRLPKAKNRLLYELQMKYMKLYKEVEDICSTKRGVFRGAFGGRYDFTSRLVIAPNPKLRIDEVEISYFAAVQLLEQTIINVLHKSYGMQFSEAHAAWERASIQKDEAIEMIIMNIIKDSGRGLPILINRNPTIAFGSILQMFVVGLTDSYTMKLPLRILPLLAGDFDGDVLNILYIVNQDFFNISNRILNPRNSMIISRNEGTMNNDVNHTKDLVVNMNTLMDIGRDSYSQSQLAKIEMMKSID